MTRTHTAPADGSAAVLGDDLSLAFVIGALLLHVFEEIAWRGLSSATSRSAMAPPTRIGGRSGQSFRRRVQRIGTGGSATGDTVR